jgi:hypothetical protein
MYIESSFFPPTWSRKLGDQVLTTAGLRLNSLLMANLLEDELDRKGRIAPSQFDPLHQKIWQNSLQLIPHLIVWGPDTFLEIHWLSHPNLESPAHGFLDISITLNCLATTEDASKEELLARYQPFQALLLTHQREAVFTPINEIPILKSCVAPFHPKHSIALVRRQQSLNLSLSFPVTTTTIGFHQEPLEARPAVKKTGDSVTHLFPWLPSFDPLHKLVDYILWYPEPVWLAIRLRSHPNPKAEDELLFRTVQQCEALLSGSLKADEALLSRQAIILKEFTLQRMMELSQGKVQLAAYVATQGPLDEALVSMMARSFLGHSNLGEDEYHLRGGLELQPITPEDMVNPTFWPDSHPFSFNEAACLFRLPWPPRDELSGLSIKRWRSAFAELPKEHYTDSSAIKLGFNTHRGVAQPVRVRLDDRMRHMFVAGQTGTGKSTFLENMILQDVRAGRGLCLIDPHGELVEVVLDKYPLERKQDLILIDLTDNDYPFALNLLAWNTLTERDFIIDELYNAVDRMYDLKITGGPIFEQHFRGMLRLLMGDGKRYFTPTILELPLLYTDDAFRQACLGGIEDETIKTFVEEAEASRGELSIANVSQYITSKFSRFSQDQRLRRIFGQKGLSINFSQAMDQGKVVLINLGKGLFGPTVSALVANQLVGRFQAAAMARAQIAPEKRREFFLYVDEAHAVVHEAFAELLAEARKYRLGLILCTQYTEQLQRQWVGRRDSLLSAVFGNVGLILSFRLGVEDAERLAGVFAPSFSALDLINLPNWEAYLKVHLGGRNIPPFNIQTIPPQSSPRDPDKVERLKAANRRKYCRSASKVDAEIKERWQKLLNPTFGEMLENLPS